VAIETAEESPRSKALSFREQRKTSGAKRDDERVVYKDPRRSGDRGQPLHPDAQVDPGRLR
jgi:hypothetical protein